MTTLNKDSSLSDIIRQAMDGRISEVMTSTIGRVQSYDPETQTADIIPVIKRPFNIGDDEVDYEELPVIPNVPLIWPRSGGFFMHQPISPGDHVILQFNHDNISMWRTKGSLTEPGELPRHSLANAVAWTGIAPAANPLKGGSQLGPMKAGLILGRDGERDVYYWDGGWIYQGIASWDPITLSTPTMAVIQALQDTVTVLQAEIAAIQQEIGALVGPLCADDASSAGNIVSGVDAAVPSTGQTAVANSNAANIRAQAESPSKLVKSL